MRSSYRENTADITRIRFTARLEVSRHYADTSGDTTGLAALFAEACAALGPTDPLVFRIECAIEEMLSRARTAAASATVWSRLQHRAAQYLPPHDKELMRISSFTAQYIRRRGGPGDLDNGITLYREELARRAHFLGDQAYMTRMTRGNLAYALLDRGRPEDLREARELLQVESEQRVELYGPEITFTGLARGNLGRTLLRLHESEVSEGLRDTRDHTLPGQALQIAVSLVQSRERRLGRVDASTLSAHLLKAHALLLLGRVEEARTAVRFVKAFIDSRSTVSVERAWYTELCRRLRV